MSTVGMTAKRKMVEETHVFLSIYVNIATSYLGSRALSLGSDHCSGLVENPKPEAQNYVTELESKTKLSHSKISFIAFMTLPAIKLFIQRELEWVDCLPRQ